MAVNANKTDQWKADVARSVDFYNTWFLRFAPKTYRDTRVETTQQVISALNLTANLTHLAADVLREHPSVLPMLRMATAPPLARDRLIGLAGVSANLVRNMELSGRISPQMNPRDLHSDLEKMANVISQLADKDIFPWLESDTQPHDDEVFRAATIVADRLTGAVADPIIRNTQERRQLAVIEQWLKGRGYTEVTSTKGLSFTNMRPGAFAFRLNVPITQTGRAKQVMIPVDVVIMPRIAQPGSLPLLIEAKSAGDFTNTNKRRKEEAIKITQLKSTYGEAISFNLFLCGYFDASYLGYEAAEGIDWVWEHRIDDLAQLGL